MTYDDETHDYHATDDDATHETSQIWDYCHDAGRNDFLFAQADYCGLFPYHTYRPSRK